MSEYDLVRTRCRELSAQMELDRHQPEIWLLTKTWTGPWPGGESEQKLRLRRDAFMRKHNITVDSQASG